LGGKGNADPLQGIKSIIICFAYELN